MLEYRKANKKQNPGLNEQEFPETLFGQNKGKGMTETGRLGCVDLVFFVSKQYKVGPHHL